MSDQPMTERTPISLGLVIYLVGLAVMTAGAWAWMQSDVAALKADAKDHQATARRLDRLEYILCATEDTTRALACERMGVLK